MSPEDRSEEHLACVLDASAILALLHSEPGGETIQKLLESAAVSSVNWSEVVQKALERKAEVEGLRQEFEALGLRIVPFSASQAEQAALWREQTRSLGLSLGDRACLALAAELGVPAVTTDRIWKDLALGVEVRTLR